MTAAPVPGPDHAPDLAEAVSNLMDLTSDEECPGFREDVEIVRAALDRAHRALTDALFGLDRAAEMAAKDPTVRRDFAELAARARDALAGGLGETRKDETE